jgi:hypothetical protein
MTNPLSFDDLQGIMHRHIAPLPDHRKKGPNTQYRMGVDLKLMGLERYKVG